MRSFRYPPFRWIGFFFCLLTLMEGAKNVVLCFGGDGHIALEASLERVCGVLSQRPVASQDSFPNTLTAPERDHCGPCVDIPLGAVTSDQQVVLVEKLAFSAATLSSMLLSSNATIPTIEGNQSFPAGSFSIFRPTSRFLNTIVLRI